MDNRSTTEVASTINFKEHAERIQRVMGKTPSIQMRILINAIRKVGNSQVVKDEITFAQVEAHLSGRSSQNLRPTWDELARTLSA